MPNPPKPSTEAMNAADDLRWQMGSTGPESEPRASEVVLLALALDRAHLKGFKEAAGLCGRCFGDSKIQVRKTRKSHTVYEIDCRACAPVRAMIKEMVGPEPIGQKENE